MKTNEKPYISLLEESFPGIKANINRCEALGFSWEATQHFTKEEKGKTLSHVALMEFPILVEGRWHNAGALHAICTQQDHREQGLATELIHKAIQSAKGRCEILLLFTEISPFYERFSFNRIQEYRFHLSRPHPKGSQPLRPMAVPHDNDLFLHCFRQRDPISNKFWIKDNGFVASFNALFATYPNYWSVYYSPSLDGLLSFQLKDRTLHLYDIVSSKMPTLDLILDHLPAAIDDIYFYFSPDRLTDEALSEPYVYDNGHLMIHDPWEITSPFMISPLSRC